MPIDPPECNQLSPQEALLERYFYKGWNQADAKVIKEVLDENIKFRLAFERKPKKGHDAFMEYMRSAHAVIGKYSCLMEDVVVSNNKAAVRVKCRGIHKGTFFGMEGSGHEVSWSSAAFFTFSPTTGRISEVWLLGDVDTLKNQISASSSAGCPHLPFRPN
jgi:predicted ester cyclase